MTATLHRLGTGRDAGLYYTNDAAREARPRNRDEYYTSDGGGVWHSTGEMIVANGSHVTAESFRDLCAGFDPRTGKALVRGAGENHRGGVDVTLTPGKSVSVLWMAGSAEQREFIELCHRTSVDRTLKLLLDEGLLVVRHGAGGVHREKPADLIVAKFDHFTTRAGDPNLHTHCVAINVAGRSDTSERYASNFLTLEPEKLYKAQILVGCAYRSALSEQLSKAGFTFRPAGQGQWEVAGIPQELIETFSKRSQEIEKLVSREASAAQKQMAALSTRAAKETVLTGQALEADWQRQLNATGLDPWKLAIELNEVVSDREPWVELSEFQEPAAVPGSTPVALAASELFRTESVLDRQKLLEKSFVAASLKGIGPDAVYAELGQLEAAGALMRLDDTHWTTPEIAAIEAGMLRAADRTAERDWIGANALAEALRNAAHLSDEQIEAVRTAAQPNGVSVIEAGAGTGKTTLAKALVAAAELSGLKVIGLAPSWVAADELSASTDIPAQAIARWRHDLASGTATTLDQSTMLLIDEAGMVGTRDMAALLISAQEAGTKVVLMGDRRQLQSVSGASALNAISDVLEQSAVLDNVRRQKSEWQRAASVLMARGNVEAGLRVYARHERLDQVYGEEAARAQVIAKWQDARERHDGEVLIVTRRNADAIALNMDARSALRQAGALGQEETALPSIGRDDKRRDLAVSTGDKLRFGETLPALGIRNGTRAVVEQIGSVQGSDTVLRLRLENGRVVQAAWSELTRERTGRQKPVPRISHGYAGTAYSVQGRTAAATILYIGRQTDAREVYVGLTRHQHDAHIVVEADRLDAACRQRQQDVRLAPTRTAMLERLFREAAQYREKPNVIDYMADRPEFIATGKILLAEPDDRWNILKSLHAGRQFARLGQMVRQVWMALRPDRNLAIKAETRLPKKLEILRREVRSRHDIATRQAERGPTIDR